MKKSILFAFIILIGLCVPAHSKGADFDWGNATVYFVITDRFCNADRANDVNYGRIVDYGSERLNAATFHGGDFENASIDYKPDYADAGFSSMVNFYFPKHGDLDNIVYTW